MEIACRQPHHSELVCLAGLPRRLARRAGTHQGSPRAPPRHSPLGGALGDALDVPWGALGVPWGTPRAPPRHPQGNSTTKDTNLRLIPPCPRKAAEALGSPRPGRRKGDPWKLRLQARIRQPGTRICDWSRPGPGEADGGPGVTTAGNKAGMTQIATKTALQHCEQGGNDANSDKNCFAALPTRRE